MDELERIYNDGYQIGVAGIRSPSPEDYEHERPHDRRDAWTDGYKAGWREFRRTRRGYSRTSIDHDESAKGRLWIEGKDKNGYQSIFDCEGGTLLAKIKLDGEVRVLAPKTNMTPEMAMMMAKALRHAATVAYRVQKDREFKPATRDEVFVQPTKRRTWKQKGAGADTTETLFILDSWDCALGLQRDIKNLYWKMRQSQAVGDLQQRIRDRLRVLGDAFP